MPVSFLRLNSDYKKKQVSLNFHDEFQYRLIHVSVKSTVIVLRNVIVEDLVSQNLV